MAVINVRLAVDARAQASCQSSVAALSLQLLQHVLVQVLEWMQLLQHVLVQASGWMQPQKLERLDQLSVQVVEDGMY